MTTESRSTIDSAPSTGGAQPDEAQQTLRSLRTLVQRLLRELPSDAEEGQQLLTVLEEHLGMRPDGLAVVTEDVPEHRLVDADIAMTELADRDPGHRLVGLGGGQMRHHLTFGDHLQQARMGQGGGTIGQVDYLVSATGPGPADTRSVVSLGLWLFAYEGVPVAVRQQTARREFGRPMGGLDIVTPDPAAAQSLVAEVRRLMDLRSVFRGQVVTFGRWPRRRFERQARRPRSPRSSSAERCCGPPSRARTLPTHTCPGRSTTCCRTPSR